jgi:hypothetical protein
LLRRFSPTAEVFAGLYRVTMRAKLGAIKLTRSSDDSDAAPLGVASAVVADATRPRCHAEHVQAKTGLKYSIRGRLRPPFSCHVPVGRKPQALAFRQMGRFFSGALFLC